MVTGRAWVRRPDGLAPRLPPSAGAFPIPAIATARVSALEAHGLLLQHLHDSPPPLAAQRWVRPPPHKGTGDVDHLAAGEGVNHQAFRKSPRVTDRTN